MIHQGHNLTHIVQEYIMNEGYNLNHYNQESGVHYESGLQFDSLCSAVRSTL